MNEAENVSHEEDSPEGQGESPDDPKAGTHPPARRGPRHRKVSEQARRDIQAETEREVAILVAEYNDRLPRELADSIGAAYARFSTGKQKSVPAQIRAILEWALIHRIFIPIEFVFFDIATRGQTRSRPGLDALMKVLERKAVATLLVFNTSRLFRKMSAALNFVDEKLVDRKLRCVFTSQDIDTLHKDTWNLVLAFRAYEDERATRVSGQHILAAHLDLFAKGQVVTSVPYGYRRKEIPGRRNRSGRLPCLLEKHPAEAKGVKQIFHWHVVDGMGITQITRELNRVPSSPGGDTPSSPGGDTPSSPGGDTPSSPGGDTPWTCKAVRYLLSNPIYHGLWSYGRTSTVWDPEKNGWRTIVRDEPLMQEHREELRIVSDEEMAKAQQIRDQWVEIHERMLLAGRSRRSAATLVSGLFYCPKHDRPLTSSGGSGAEYLRCPDCFHSNGDQSYLYTMLGRERALEMTCQALSERIMASENRIREVIEVCRRAAASPRQTDTDRLPALKAKDAEFKVKIAYNLENPGDTELDRIESASKLRELRRGRKAVQDELAVLSSVGLKPGVVPDEQQVRDLLAGMKDVLSAASKTADREIFSKARDLLIALTGGRIDVIQMGERKPKMGWLQGQFRDRLLPTLLRNFAEGMLCDPTGEPVTVDYRFLAPYQRLSGRAKELSDKGLTNLAISEKLGIDPRLVARAIQYYHAQHGLPWTTYAAAREKTSIEKIMALDKEGKSLREIALELGVTVKNVDLKLRYAGVAFVRTRVKQAGITTLEGRSIDEIARTLDVSPRSVSHYLGREGGRCGPYDTSARYQAHLAKLRAANFARDNLIGDLCREGKTVSEIVRVVGLCYRSVVRIIQVKGFDRTKHCSRSVRNDASLMTRIAAYKREGMSDRQIARVLEISYSSVNRAVLSLRNQAVPPSSEPGVMP